MQKRSNLAILLGGLMAVIGVVAVLLILNNDDDKPKTVNGAAVTTTVPGNVAVVVTKALIPAGTQGSDAVAQGLVAVESVALAQKQTDAIQSTAQLVGQVFAQDVPAGSQVLGAELRVAGLVGGNPLPTPAGQQAMAVSIDFVAGVAGYPKKGDFVNVYGLDEAKKNSVLLFSHVLILDISTEALASNNQNTTATTVGRVAPQSLIYLLAVDPPQAGKIAVFSRFASLYLTLQPTDQQPVGTGATATL